MRPVKPFICLSLGYAGIWAVVLILDGNNGRFPFFEILASALVMAMIFYPPVAASVLFWLQTGFKGWLFTALFSGFLAIPFTYLFESSFNSPGRFGYLFVVAALFIAVILSALILIKGCISSLQRRETRFFGFLTLYGSLVFIPVFILVIGNGFSLSNGFRAIIISGFAGAIFLSGFTGLVLAVFRGPKPQEIKNPPD